MSENLDLVRSSCAGLERGDWSSAEWAHGEIEFVAADGPDPGKSIGVAAMAERWRWWVSTWENSRSEADEYRELEGGRVLVFMRHWGPGPPEESLHSHRNAPLTKPPSRNNATHPPDRNLELRDRLYLSTSE